jgi:hypothetical protein
MKKNKKGADLIKIIQASNNVREACKQLGISKSQYYKLLNQPELVVRKKNPPRKLDQNTVEKILNLALQFPFGCHFLSSKLSEEEVFISGVSIQKLLQQHNLGTVKARFEHLAQTIVHDKAYSLNNEQKEFISRYNPALLEAGREIEKPGQLISVFSIFLGLFPYLGKVFGYFSLDAYSGYVLAVVSYIPDKVICAGLLKDVIVPFYGQMGLEIKQVETSNDPEFFSYGAHPFSSFLRARPSTEHLLTSVGGPKTNGFCQRFYQYLSLYMLPLIKTKKADFTDLEQFQEEIKLHLEVYNRKLNPETRDYFEAYPFFGKSPVEILQSGIKLN